MARKKTDERRAQIVSALLRVMAHHGYPKATINRIAAEAQLTPGLLHYHFGNKQEILLALLERLVETELRELEPPEGASPPEQLAAVIDRTLATGEQARPDAVAAWVTISTEAIRQPAVQREYEEALGRLAELITDVIVRGIADGSWRPVATVNAIVAAFLALVHGYFVLAAAARDFIPTGSAAPAARAMLSELLATELP